MTLTDLDSTIQDAITLIDFAARGKVHCELALEELVRQHTRLEEDREMLDQQIIAANQKIDKAQNNLTYAILNLLRIKSEGHHGD